ncbi:MAG: peptidoglycan editing factor PgeF [Candidatus Methylomirabilales bacterium]
MAVESGAVIECEEPGYLRLAAWVEQGIPHAFSTRKGGVSRPPFASLNLSLSTGDDPEAVWENRRRFFGAFGFAPEQPVRVRQVHGASVLVVDEALARREGFPRLLLDDDYRYDALVTDRPGLPLTVGTADCLPIFLYDPVRPAVAALHAGWRGTVARIVEETIRTMQDRYGSDPATLIAAFGPGILGCCYEVDRPVIEPLAQAVLGWESCVEPAGGDRWNLDLAAVNRILLGEAGLGPDRILDTGLCTACRKDRFYSYRAEGPRTGRMMSWIALPAEQPSGR